MLLKQYRWNHRKFWKIDQKILRRILWTRVIKNEKKIIRKEKEKIIKLLKKYINKT